MKQQEEVALDTQSQQEVVSHSPNNEEIAPLKEIFYELCRFDSLDNFLNTLKCLNVVKDKLSVFEILLILGANLFMFYCAKHRDEFIKKAKFKAQDMSLILQLIESTISFLLAGVRSGRLKMPLQGRTKFNINTPMTIFMKIHTLIETQTMVDSFAVAFPNHSKEIFERKDVISKILEEIHHFFLANANLQVI